MVDQLADRLEAHKFLTLHEVSSQPGLSQEALDTLERRFGVKLSKPVRDLYGWANGFLLHWTMRPDLSGVVRVTAGDQQYELRPKAANLEYPDAMIRFLPLEEVLGLDWSPQFFADEQSQYDYRGERLETAQIRARLRPFDECGLFCVTAFSDASFERVILVTDHLCNWNDSIEMDFSAYVDFVFGHAGLLEARMDVFVRGGSARGGALTIVHES
jgi:hypothetical protein